MSTISQIIRSRTVWTILAIFVFNGLTAVQPNFDNNWRLIIDAVLAALAVYFRANPIQKFDSQV